MIDYKPLYYFLFNGITDIINEMDEAPEKAGTAMYSQHLKLLQLAAEELYLRQEDEEEDE